MKNLKSIKWMILVSVVSMGGSLFAWSQASAQTGSHGVQPGQQQQQQAKHVSCDADALYEIKSAQKSLDACGLRADAELFENLASELRSHLSVFMPAHYEERVRDALSDLTDAYNDSIIPQASEECQAKQNAALSSIEKNTERAIEQCKGMGRFHQYPRYHKQHKSKKQAR